MDSVTDTPPPKTAMTRPSSAPLPIREDCWSEDATFTLIDAWGDRYLELNSGNLRQKHWQEVAGAVNARHGNANRKSRRTDVQCKNRIDTLKKKYKIEKARVSESNGSYASPWPLFAPLDALIGATYKPSPPVARVSRKTNPMLSPVWTLSSPVPVAPRSGTQKRPSPASITTAFGDSFFSRHFSAFAAAAAEVEEEEEERDSEDSEGSGSRSRSRDRGGGKEVEYSGLAQAIERFVDIYERVEVSKQRQLIELEKQRMQFAKDLEYQRMQLFMEMQVHLRKIKRAKRASGAGEFPGVRETDNIHELGIRKTHQ